MNRRKTSAFLKRLVPQIIVQSLAIVITAIASYYTMTWLIVDVAKVQSTYLSTTYETLGTLALMIVVLVTTNTYTYRKRSQEVKTLSDAIYQVANGDFGYRIGIRPKEPMAEIYEDFNKMITELQSVQLLRNDFINSYSHEFKTPIASINGFAELLLEKDLKEEDRRQYLEIIRDESERLSSLAKNTILLSNLTSQQIVTDTEEYNLGEQLRQCAIILSRNWMEKEQEFNGEFPDIPYTGNRELMQHLWLNLLGNAVKYTPQGGTISASLTRQSDNAVVQITDTGIGMDKETMQHLFMPYYQGDTSRSTQGLGLGLSISQRIVELCSGTISVDSVPGKGSTFTVTLPLGHSESAAAESPIPPSWQDALKALRELGQSLDRREK